MTSIKKKFAVLILFMTSISLMAQEDIKIKIIETSDVHGCFFPYDFINMEPMKGTLSRVFSYVQEQCIKYGDNVILLDNGDILQGQPSCYYNNYVKPELENVAASVVNYMGYDAQTIGNHDVETGHAVYDKWISEVNCPVLGANVIDTATGRPYLTPYTIIERSGIRIAIIGMLTAAIPNWLHEDLWSGLRFENMVTSAKKWVKIVQEAEHPDLIVGLFHSGKEGGIVTDEYEEDASMRVAQEVDGFDIIFYGHDHTTHKDWFDGPSGKQVLCLDPSSNAIQVAEAEVVFDSKSKTIKTIKGGLRPVVNFTPDKAFLQHFQPVTDSVNAYVNRCIGRLKRTIYSKDCYFGNAPFTDLIHDLQLSMTGADVSFNAPLTFDICVQEGDIHVSDLFNLYRYENQIYALKMTGREIRDFLEMSYDLWVNTMSSPDDHIMLLQDGFSDDKQRYSFKNLAFNFDSAAGIDYEVDVTKPDGEKVHILRMSNGEPFEFDRWYLVTMNSYRGNGGGELLTKGAGIPLEELKNRIVFRSEKDQRHYLKEWIEKRQVIDPQAHDNWRFVPESWTKPAIERDRKLIFGE